jgi:threonine dehydratase
MALRRSDPMLHRPPTLRDVYVARQRIACLARRTPLIDDPRLSKKSNRRIVHKPENLQATGSFKIRGATNKLLSLSKEQSSRGVVAHSSGNHGRALSYVASRLGIQATICLPDTVPENKKKAIGQLGAELVMGGAVYDDVFETTARLQRERGLTVVEPYDDPFVIAGQGTIGLELLEDFPEIDTVLVPLSGGGLMGGIALALKSADPRIRTIGVSMDRGPAMVESLRAGRLVEVVQEPTLADALAGGLGPENHYSFKMIQTYVDDTVLVSEEEIAAAMAFALEEHHLVVEGGAAVGIAALLSEKVRDLGRNVAVVLSGGNVDLPILLEAVQNHR